MMENGPTADSLTTVRESVFRDITSEGLRELQRFSQFSPRRNSLSPGAPEFEGLPSPTQNLIRRSTAAVALKPMRGAIRRALCEGIFDPNAPYNEATDLLQETSVKNPFVEPIGRPTTISPEELAKMQEIAGKDPSLITFFDNKKLTYLPHPMRREFKKLGIILIIIRKTLIPEAAAKMEKEGIPRTYRKKVIESVDIPPEHPFGSEGRLRYETEKRHAMRRKRIRSRRRRGSIWPSY